MEKAGPDDLVIVNIVAKTPDGKVPPAPARAACLILAVCQ